MTNRPWHDERSQRDHYWMPTLRHTYATTALAAGGNPPSYITRQMRHKNAKMLLAAYAKWIDRADWGREKAKLEALREGHRWKNKRDQGSLTVP